MAENNSNTPENGRPAIQIHNQYIRDLSLEIPHAPEIFKAVKSQPEIKIDVNINSQNLGGSIYNVELRFRVDGDVENQKFFILEMVYAGIAEINVPEEHIRPVLMIEIPHMLFPFARQAVTSTLYNGGLPPVMLNPIDFVAMYQAHAAGNQKGVDDNAPEKPAPAND